jgi:hypothetical protein
MDVVVKPDYYKSLAEARLARVNYLKAVRAKAVARFPERIILEASIESYEIIRKYWKFKPKHHESEMLTGLDNLNITKIKTPQNVDALIQAVLDKHQSNGTLFHQMRKYWFLVKFCIKLSNLVKVTYDLFQHPHSITPLEIDDETNHLKVYGRVSEYITHYTLLSHATSTKMRNKKYKPDLHFFVLKQLIVKLNSANQLSLRWTLSNNFRFSDYPTHLRFAL